MIQVLIGVAIGVVITVLALAAVGTIQRQRREKALRASLISGAGDEVGVGGIRQTGVNETTQVAETVVAVLDGPNGRRVIPNAP